MKIQPLIRDIRTNDLTSLNTAARACVTYKQRLHLTEKTLFLFLFFGLFFSETHIDIDLSVVESNPGCMFGWISSARGPQC